MTVSWNWEIIDERIAMDMSLFTEADIPDVGPRHPDAEHWIWHYFANTVVRARFDGAPDRYAALMIRRITIRPARAPLRSSIGGQLGVSRFGSTCLPYTTGSRWWRPSGSAPRP
jgi:hypothetical protein